jgi:hypothetical protein
LTDPTVQPPPPPAPQHRGLVRGVILVVALVAVAVGATLYLAGHRVQPDPGKGTGLEEQWDNTIRRLGLGIQPVYPPQEDFAVGDVFATVVDTGHTTYAALEQLSESFSGKSVKLGHADVSKMLDDAYQAIPLFPDTPPESQAIAPASSEATPVSLFGAHAERSELPRAAFPGLTITDDGSAATGLTGNPGWFNFGASRAASQKLVLGAVETYGIDAVAGEKALNEFCTAPATSGLCMETAARKYLWYLLGDRVFLKHFDPDTQAFQYDLTIQVIMVYRIYLAREIVEQWSSLVSEGGGVKAALAGEGEAVLPSDQPKSAGDAANSLEQRMEVIEQQLSNTRRGGALVYRSSAGTDILLDQKFPRPVAVGYRSVARGFAAGAASAVP